jgi:hypothetical protein
MLGAVGFVALPDSAFAQAAITANQWYTGPFTATGSPIFGKLWDRLHTRTDLAVADLRQRDRSSGQQRQRMDDNDPGPRNADGHRRPTSGDVFELFDNNVPMTWAASPFGPTPQNPGQTANAPFRSVPCSGCEFQGANPDINYFLGDANYSSGTVALHNGVNVITGTFVGDITYGNVNLIVEDVPETSTWVMMGLGFAGLAFASYRARARIALAA